MPVPDRSAFQILAGGVFSYAELWLRAEEDPGTTPDNALPAIVSAARAGNGVESSRTSVCTVW